MNNMFFYLKNLFTSGFNISLDSGLFKFFINKTYQTSKPAQQKRRLSSCNSLSTESWKKRYYSIKSETDEALLQNLIQLIKEQNPNKIVVMAGAGISTPSGLPDFRSPGTGLYDNLQKYNIPTATAIFDIDYFHIDPRPFFELTKELYPGKYRPNYVHYFVRLLNDKNLLLRMYTQNIDGLERIAGIPPDKLVEAHGSFTTATCTVCQMSYTGEEIKEIIFAGEIPKCKFNSCKGVVKPDIVFFGEDLPKRFRLFMKDMPRTDLLIVLGTSLEVEPFASIGEIVGQNTPRLLINRELVGSFCYKRPNDAIIIGDVVEGVKKFVHALGWNEELDRLIHIHEK